MSGGTKMKKENREKAKMLSNLVNNMTLDYEGICEEMTREHRTLQQQFTTLCLTWLSTVAEDDYQTDGRNEESKIVAKELLEGYKEKTGFDLYTKLPYI